MVGPDNSLSLAVICYLPSISSERTYRDCTYIMITTKWDPVVIASLQKVFREVSPARDSVWIWLY